MTITADFSGGEKTVTTEPLYQWDTGQKLAFSGLPATSTDIQVHFANAAMAQAIVKATAIENSLPTCDIPNEFLQFGSAAKARAWVFYKASSTEGYTVRTVLIPVTPRKRPNDYVSPEDPDSQGIVKRTLELLEHYQSDLDALQTAINAKAPASTAYTFDSTTTNVTYNAANPKTIYTNAYINNKNAFVFTTANNYYQIALCYDGTEYKRELTAGGSTTYTPWALVNNENTGNKKTTLTGNELSNNFYPTTKAVADALSTKAPASTTYTFDTTTTNVVYNTANPKTIYLNATVDGEHGIVITAKDNGFQYFLGQRGALKIRSSTGEASYSDWTQVTEYVGNKISAITASNKTSTTLYPSIKAVVDYLVANYENLSNKLTSADGIDKNSTDTKYPSAKAVFNFGVDILDDVAGSLVLKENHSNKKNAIAGNETSKQYYPSIKAVVDYIAANYENSSNKLTSEEGIGSTANDVKYPTAKAVYDLGVEIVGLVNDDISNVESRLVLKESFSNKKNTIAGNETSNQFYPTTKAVYDYGTTITNNIEDVKAYIGYTDGDILGLHADFENKRFTRLGAAVGLTAGQDFNAFPMYGQRRRVVVGSDGVIIDGYSPEDVGESDTDVDVMVYQPKFYYKVVPLKLEKQTDGLGYHIRKANYYISSTPHAGFKLHPLFYDENGNEIDYVLFSAYEASYMWRRQVSTNGTDFRYVDSIFHDGVDTDTTIETSAVLKSLPGVKPISGQYKAMNKTNMENCALRKSSNWHLDTIQSVAANQLLIAIEYGAFNTQLAIGHGVVSNANNGSNNCSSLTGSTSAATFNTDSGMASETIYDVAGSETPFNTNGKLAISYRGMENPWGNIWKHTNGINLFGDGTEKGCQIYIAEDFNFNESVKGEVTISGINYRYCNAGFTMSNATGYVSAFGYGNEKFDWLFIPSEVLGNNSVPVGDNCEVLPNATNYRVVLFGGNWNGGPSAGDYCVFCTTPARTGNSFIGGRLLFVPTATV